MRVITNSEFRTYQLCRERHRFAYALGVRPRVADPSLAFGTMIHEALEVWMLSRDLGAALRSIEQNGEHDTYDKARAQAMVTGYHARWVDDEIEVLDVEVRFKVARAGYTYSGRIDAIGRLQDGRDVIIEHKTSNRDVHPAAFGADKYWAERALDSQVSNYFDGARSLGYDIQGCVYDVLRKVSLKPRKRETPGEYFERCCDWLKPEHFVRKELTRLEHELGENREDLGRIADEIQRAEPSTRQPRSAGACTAFGRLCEYHGVCTGTESIDSDNFVTLETRHPELEKE